MHRVLVLGSGKTGSLISGLLGGSGSYQIDLADMCPQKARAVSDAHSLRSITPYELDANSSAALDRHLGQHKTTAVISALPHECNRVVAESCRRHGLHYFDLTEDVETTRAIIEIADGAKTCFAPQCGLAPGFIAIAANELIGHFDEVHEVKMRVGALPQNPSNIRYPGHCDAMRLLMFELKLNRDRDTLQRILENAIPRTLQDVVLIYVSVTGRQNGELMEESLVRKLYPQQIDGRLWGAIQLTTAAGIAAVVDLVLSDPGSYQGFLRQEQFALGAILDNRFGRYYGLGDSSAVSAQLVTAGQHGVQRKVA